MRGFRRSAYGKTLDAQIEKELSRTFSNTELTLEKSIGNWSMWHKEKELSTNLSNTELIQEKSIGWSIRHKEKFPAQW